MFLGSQFDPRMCFLLVNFVHKLANQLGTRDVFFNFNTFRDYSGTVSNIQILKWLFARQ
jgi:hypothetical protein